MACISISVSIVLVSAIDFDPHFFLWLPSFIFFLVFACLLDMVGNTTYPGEKRYSDLRLCKLMLVVCQLKDITLGGAVIPTQG